MAFTKIVGAGIHTLSNVHTHNINSSGIITATQFVGVFTGGGGDLNSGIVTCTTLDVNGNGDISGNLVLGGDLTVNGTTTTLDTALTEVDKVEVAANNSTVGVAITQSGSGDILRLYDGTAKVLAISDDGKVGIGSQNAQSKLHVAGVSTTVWPFSSAVADTYAYTPYPHEVVIDNDVRGVEGSFASIYFNAGSHTDGSAVGTARIGAIETGNHKADLVFSNRGYPGNGGGFDDHRENVRIKYNGNVGIGTNDPGADTNLHILDQTDRCRLLLQAGGNESSQLWLQNPTRTWKIHNYYDQNALTFSDDSDERLRIDADGKVGIGTTNPGFKLDVDYSGGEDGIRILNRGTASGSTSMLRLGNDENVNAAFLMLNSSGYGSVGGAYNLVLGHGLNRDIVFSTGGTEKVRILSGGNVGIGSVIPTDKLDVQTGTSDEVTKFKVKTAGQLELTRNHASAPYIKTFMSSGNPAIHLGDSSGDRTVIHGHGNSYFNGGNLGVGTNSPSATIEATGSNSSVGYLFKNTHATSGFGMRIEGGGTSDDRYSLAVFNAAGDERFRVNANGKVGIGTYIPDEILHVSSGASGDCILILEADTDNAGSELDNPYIKFLQDGGIEESVIGMNPYGTNDENNALVLANSVANNAGIIFKTGTTNGYTNASEKMRITTGDCASFGNSSPPAWDSGSGYYNIQLGNAAFFRADTDSGSNFLSFGINAYRDNTNWKFIEDGRATQVSHQAGEIFFNTSNNGSAGGAITFTERFRLTAGGDVQIKVDGSGGTSSQQGVLRFTRTAYSNDMKDSRIVFDTSSASNNSDNNTYCSIIAGTRTTSDNGSSDLRFYTCNSDNSYAVSEKLRIAEDGKVKIGSGVASLALLHIAPTLYGINLQNDSNNKSRILFSKNSAGNDSRAWIEGNGELTGYIGFAAGDEEKVRILPGGNGQNIAHFRDGTSAADSTAYITMQTGYPFTAPTEGACQIGVARNGSGNQSHFIVRTSSGSTMNEALRIRNTRKAYFASDIYWSGTANSPNNHDYGRFTVLTGTTSGYGFSMQHSTHLVMLNQQGGTNQAMVLADTSPGQNTSVLWGVSATDNGATVDNDGSETWSQKARVEGNGDFVHAGSHSASGSDDRLKKNKVGITSALSKVCAMEGFTYEWNDVAEKVGMADDDKHLGLSAQTVEPLVPEVVVVNDMLVNPDDGTNDYKTIRYERLVPLLVEAIKDLKADNDALKARISALEGS